jgi:formate/nitrite transporter FocA (FNT family)
MSQLTSSSLVINVILHFLADQVFFSGISCILLVNLSVAVSAALNSSLDSGSVSMKSIVIMWNDIDRLRIGCRLLYDL